MRERGDETNGDSMVLGLITHGTIGVGQNQQKNHPWREHCCKMDTKDTYWKIHRKPIDWKPRQNNRNHDYQAIVDH